MTLPHVLDLCVSPNFRYSSKGFAEIYRALVQQCGGRIKKPEAYFQRLFRRLIISIKKQTFTKSTFPNSLTSKEAMKPYQFSYNSLILIVFTGTTVISLRTQHLCYKVTAS